MSVAAVAIPAIAAAGASIIGSLFSSSSQSKLTKQQIRSNENIANATLAQNEKWSQKNYDYMIDAYDYQRELNDLTMSREDNAVQRRVADLKAAGLNPILAAGDSANSASFRAGTAPQYDDSYLGDYAQRRIANNNLRWEQKMAETKLKLDMVSQAMDISRTMAETQLMRSRANQVDTMTPLNAENTMVTNEYLRNVNPVKYQKMVADLDNTEKHNILLAQQEELNKYHIGAAEYEKAQAIADVQFRNVQVSDLEKKILVNDALLRKYTVEANYWEYLGRPQAPGLFGALDSYTGGFNGVYDFGFELGQKHRPFWEDKAVPFMSRVKDWFSGAFRPLPNNGNSFKGVSRFN